MTEQDDRDRELAELKAQVERLSARNNVPPKVEVTGGPSSGGGFKGGFFGCFGVVAAIVVLISVLVGIGRCSSDTAKPGSAAPPSSASAAVGAAPTAPAENWTYTSTTDAMSDKQTNEACTTSTNEVTQTFPYHDTTARLCIRQSPKFGLDAFVELNGDGQILCGIESCSLPVRIDKAPAQKFPAVGAADNSSNIIFINRTASFIAALKKSSTAAIEVTLYQNGVQPLTFNTSGLKWTTGTASTNSTHRRQPSSDHASEETNSDAYVCAHGDEADTRTIAACDRKDRARTKRSVL